VSTSVATQGDLAAAFDHTSTTARLASMAWRSSFSEQRADANIRPVEPRIVARRIQSRLDLLGHREIHSRVADEHSSALAALSPGHRPPRAGAYHARPVAMVPR